MQPVGTPASRQTVPQPTVAAPAESLPFEIRTLAVRAAKQDVTNNLKLKVKIPHIAIGEQLGFGFRTFFMRNKTLVDRVAQGKEQLTAAHLIRLSSKQIQALLGNAQTRAIVKNLGKEAIEVAIANAGSSTRAAELVRFLDVNALSEAFISNLNERIKQDPETNEVSDDMRRLVHMWQAPRKTG